ncbi:unnamed protein product [Schistosoma margrebowiei]|uniref:Lethal giant larvae homologue 2 domain-containing protein n=1 Tax=Schistosoma margrebowiei TaxID=48269 RepID=A0AA85AG64_9TREM|nr:unnamed protein product [Schistosoma margrebowiei]
MAQRILEPFRKLPHQLQNLEIVKRIHDYTLGKHTDSYSCYQSSAYGCLESPSALAFDEVLGLLAVGTSKGVIKIYGSPGIVFTVQREGSPIISLLFLPGEGRIVCASTDGTLDLFELDSRSGRWSPTSQVKVQQTGEQDLITCICLGHGVIYIGSANGTLRQVAVKNGHMTLGDDTLTACTSSIISDSVPADKRDQLGVDSSIISLELQPQGNHLLIAYAGGCVAVAIPQPIPSESVTQPAAPADGVTAPTAQGEVVTPNVVDELAPTIPQETQGEATPGDKTEVNEEKSQQVSNDSAVESTPSTPAKGHSEKRSTLKFKALTRSLRPDASKAEKEEPSLPVPPAPRISHLLLRDQPVEWASWRVTSVDSLSTEVVVAYGDGAFQVWPIVAAVSDQPFEPIIVSMIDPPNTPYGPLPCGAINKILISPSANAGLLTVFCGGLPRPQFENRYAVSVLQDHEHQTTPQQTKKSLDETSPKDEIKEQDQPVEPGEKKEIQENVEAVGVTEQPTTSVESEELKQQSITDNAEVDVPPEPIQLSQEDIVSSAVRCLLFSETYIQVGDRAPSVWVGTASGKVLAFNLSWRGTAGPVKATLSKELQLHHHSPIVSLYIIDAVDHGPIMHSQAYRNSCVESVESNEKQESAQPSEPPAEVSMDGGKDTEIPIQSTSATQDVHQLLLCSEEQVKLFSIPSLRPIYKHKFIDRLRMLGMSVTSSAGPTSKPEKEVTEEAADTVVGESEVVYVNTSQINPKRVTGFGLQNFTSGSGENAKLEWNAVATLLDGQIAVLSLPNLRKVFKERCYPGYLPSSTLPCVATRTYNTHVFWSIGCRLLVSELNPIPLLNSFATPVSDVITDDFIAIHLPEWARTASKDVSVENENLKTSNQTNLISEPLQGTGNITTDEKINGCAPVVEEEIIPTNKMNDTILENGQNIGDVTLDSIKEYLNGTDVTMVVKTTELSTEKRTLVEGGKITTTVHEVEKVDGKITKDDVVKFVADGEPEVVSITGTV